MGMLNLVLSNISRKPVTRLYPFEERKAFEGFKGRVVFNPENCILCGICQKKCPADAITVTKAEQQWELNAFRCIMCVECAGGCPKNCISISTERRTSASQKEYIKTHVEVKPKAEKAKA